MNNIIFYSDSWSYGGHEIMSLRMIEAIAAKKGHNIIVYSNKRNSSFNKRISRLQKNYNNLISKESLPVINGFKGLLLRVGILVNGSPIRRLAKEFKKDNPIKIIALQGNIELSVAALFAANRMGIYSISYIPQVRSFRETAEKLGLLRDIINNRLFKLPSQFITISQSLKKAIHRRNNNIKVDVLYNYVNKSDSNVEKNIRSGITIGIVGLVDFSNKSQDFLVKTMVHHFKEIDWQIVVAGDGPDIENLKKLCIKHGASDKVRILGWMNDIHKIYREIDILAIPSRFEGFPLVMIEALLHNIPVVGTCVDGMQEFLPKDWLFSYRNELEFKSALQNIMEDEKLKNKLNQLKVRINSEMIKEKFIERCLNIIAN